MANKTSKQSAKVGQSSAAEAGGDKAAAERVRANAAKPRKTAPKSLAKSSARNPAKPKLLSGGNPQIAKAYGDAPVEAYIAAMPGWKRGIGKRLDALIVRNVPGVHKAVKWNSPFYGSPQRQGEGWWVQ